MTSPVPDALRTQLAEVLAAWMARPYPPDQSQIDNADDASYDLWPYVDAALAAARVEGAAEALREAAESVTELAEELRDAEDEAENAEVSWALGVARLRAEVKAESMQDRAAALSAPTTTEGDPT